MIGHCFGCYQVKVCIASGWNLLNVRIIYLPYLIIKGAFKRVFLYQIKRKTLKVVDTVSFKPTATCRSFPRHPEDAHAHNNLQMPYG